MLEEFANASRTMIRTNAAQALTAPLTDAPSAPTSPAMLQEEIDGANSVYAQTVPAGTTPIDDAALSALDVNNVGFYAVAYEVDGAVIVAFEGTQLAPTPYGLQTIAADIQIFRGQTPQAFDYAIEFVLDVQAVAGSMPVYITGHSLGGAEAEAVAAFAANPSNDLSIVGGVTFGAPGLPGYCGPADLGGLTDYVDYGDPVGNYARDGELADIARTGDHFGTVQFVGPPRDAAITAFNLLTGNFDQVFQFHALSHYAEDLGLTIEPSAEVAAAHQGALAAAIHAEVAVHAVDGAEGATPHVDLGAAHAHLHHFLV
jgi:hypothetical protein